MAQRIRQAQKSMRREMRKKIRITEMKSMVGDLQSSIKGSSSRIIADKEKIKELSDEIQENNFRK